MISAKVILHSRHAIFNHEIATLRVTFPRYILAEKNTHRMLSKNSASSRAIPYKKMLKSVMTNPFIPIAWQKDHTGMQGTEYLDPNKEYAVEDVLDVLTPMLTKTFKDPETGKWDEDYVEVDKTLNSILSQLFHHGEKYNLKGWWLKCRDMVISSSLILNAMGVTKQLCNRLLEPFMWHTVLVTATEWENFFALRCPQYTFVDDNRNITYFRSRKDFMKADAEQKSFEVPVSFSEIGWLSINRGSADIHIMALAEAMWDALNESTPQELQPGEWHIPFRKEMDLGLLHDYYRTLTNIEQPMGEFETQTLVKISTAMCARTSYTVFGEDTKQHSYIKDIELHDKLSVSGHWSPFEHCAKAMQEQEYELHVNGKLQWTGGQYDKPLPTEGSEGWCGNFRGFIQYRKMFVNENIT